MMNNKNIIFAVTVLFTLFCKGSCINCFYCNSANNSACLDVSMYDDETKARILPVINCERSIPNAEQINFFCRKITQTIFHSHRDTEVRVTRGCGWVPHEKECYRADNRDHLETVCQCFTDHCNSGDSASPPAAVALFVVLAAVLYFYR